MTLTVARSGKSSYQETHPGEFVGIKPLGNAVRIDLAAFYRSDADSRKLISEKIYYDQATLAAQMKGLQVPQ